MPIITTRVEPDDFVRGKVVSRPSGGVASPRLPHEQGRRFVEHMLAREEFDVHVLKRVPAAAARAVVLVAGQDPSDQRPYPRTQRSCSGCLRRLTVKVVIVTRGYVSGWVAFHRREVVQ